MVSEPPAANCTLTRATSEGVWTATTATGSPSVEPSIWAEVAMAGAPAFEAGRDHPSMVPTMPDVDTSAWKDGPAP
jgi:hypothetical protein